MFANPNAPNLPDFVLFIQGVMAINPLFLPSDSPFPGYALNRARALVIRVPVFVCAGIEYTLAVYNCAGAILVRTTPDQAMRSTEPGSFTWLRNKYGLDKPSFGVVSSTSDEGTSVSLAVPDALKQLTLGDLQFLQTPWGREFLSYNQDFGGVFGIS